MDFQYLLQSWKHHQLLKLKMANSYTCQLSFSYSRTILQGKLSFIESNGIYRMEISDNNTDLRSTILLSEIIGYTPHLSSLRFSLPEGKFILLEFPDERTREVAQTAFENIERREYAPTPPSSDTSD